jgi:glucose-1-phosphate thymidylyltransferase
VVGTPMVERIVNTFTDVLPRPLTEAVFVLGDFPQEVNDALTAICERHEMKASFVYQDKALGTGHAVNCARDYLEGEVISVFADTLFSMDHAARLDDADVVAWVKHVDDPSRFGVAVREGDRIVELVEKPQTLISTEALIGIYYVKEGERLKAALHRLIEEDITGHGNEYQLTDAFDILIKDGLLFKTEGVSEWLDCGTIPAFVETSMHLLEKDATTSGSVTGSEIQDPVFIGEDAVVENSALGPNVIVEPGAKISNSTLSNTIVFSHADVDGSTLVDSIIGRHAKVNGADGTMNIGDHSSVG